MKYYYAIAHCNTPKTANFLYDEYNGFEFENSNIRLNISIVPDEVVFEQKVKEFATDIPDGYEFSFENQQKLSNTFGHTKVNLTWDQTDIKRSTKLQNGFTREVGSDEENDDYYKGLIASSGDDSEESDIEETRKKLLTGLSGKPDLEGKNLEDIDWDAINSDELDSEQIGELEKTGKIEQKKNKKSSVDVKFSKGFGDNVGKKL